MEVAGHLRRQVANSQFQLAHDPAYSGQVDSVQRIGLFADSCGHDRPITAGLNFGSIRTGITLSASQKAQVEQTAGLDVSTIIEQQGLLPANP